MDGHGATWRPMLWVGVAALALRLAAIGLLDTPERAAPGDAWQWGAESACLARSLVEHGVYGDPWCQGSGPSSWLTPPYPALLALLMWIFGGLTAWTALALHVVQSLLSAAIAPLLMTLGKRMGLPREGRLAAWLWALYPLAIWNAAKTVWDTTAVACGTTAFLVVLWGYDGSARRVLRAGLAFGALLFLNPAPIALLPGAAWLIARRAQSPGRALGHLALFCALALAVCLPWMLRNQRVLGTLALRPNFGVELRIGNNDLADGRPVVFAFHPSRVPAELAAYRALGETAYCRDNRARAWSWIRTHPERFAVLCLRRAGYFWVGQWPSADRRRAGPVEPGGDPNSWLKFAAFASLGLGALGGLAVLRAPGGTRAALAWMLLAFGGPYYLTHVSERYRFPLDPLLTLLCASLLLAMHAKLRSARPTP